jgi:hypothetical protein
MIVLGKVELSQRKRPMRAGIIIAAGAMLASGWAESPENVSMCGQHGQEGSNHSTTPLRASNKQNDTRTGDRVGVVVLLCVSTPPEPVNETEAD